MINIKKLPVDCSVETLFPDAEELLKGEPLGYSLQYVGNGLHLKVYYWGITLDPAEDNIRRSDGTIDHDNYMCLCKWDGEPITVRYPKRDITHGGQIPKERIC